MKNCSKIQECPLGRCLLEPTILGTAGSSRIFYHCNCLCVSSGRQLHIFCFVRSALLHYDTIRAAVRELGTIDMPMHGVTFHDGTVSHSMSWGLLNHSTMPDNTLPRPFCRNVSEDFCCINVGGFSRGFSWRRIFAGIFLEDFSGHFFPTKMRRKNPARRSAKKSGAQK